MKHLNEIMEGKYDTPKEGKLTPGCQYIEVNPEDETITFFNAKEAEEFKEFDSELYDELMSLKAGENYVNDEDGTIFIKIK